jgi:hypothetical protein
MKVSRSDIVRRLLAKARVRQEETQKAQERVDKKRSERRNRSGNSSGDKKPVPNFGKNPLLPDVDKGQDICGQTDKNKIYWYHVMGWFRDAILKTDPNWLVVSDWEDRPDEQTWWTWREKKCAERLLKRYGADVVEATVIWFVANWQAMKAGSRGRLTGAPTVNLLWTSRERIFPDAKIGVVISMPEKRRRDTGRRKHMVGEYDERAQQSASEMPGIGWVDDGI